MSGAIRIELTCVESVIENEIKQGCSQKDIAQTYAMGMVSSWPTNWGVVNAAIAAKWPKGLERIKKRAWKIVEERSGVPLVKAGE